MKKYTHRSDMQSEDRYFLQTDQASIDSIIIWIQLVRWRGISSSLLSFSTRDRTDPCQDRNPQHEMKSPFQSTLSAKNGKVEMDFKPAMFRP